MYCTLPFFISSIIILGPMDLAVNDNDVMCRVASQTWYTRRTATASNKPERGDRQRGMGGKCSPDQRQGPCRLSVLLRAYPPVARFLIHIRNRAEDNRARHQRAGLGIARDNRASGQRSKGWHGQQTEIRPAPRTRLGAIHSALCPLAVAYEGVLGRPLC